MRLPILALAATVAIAAPLNAQDNHSPAGDMAPLQNMFMGWVIAASEAMTEEDYAFKPTPAVRSFGQLVGHVANSNYMICATILGESSPSTVDFEKATRPAIIAGVKAAKAYCDRAYTMPHDAAMKPVDLFGMKGNGVWALGFNATHNAEHYGNVVTYMRMRGKTPPSSM